MVVNNILISLLLLISPMGVNARFSPPPILQNSHRYTTPNTISHSHNKCRYTKTISNIKNTQHNSILQIRGGNMFGRSKSNDDEYEYEYYEIDDNTSNSDDSEYYYEEEDTDYLLSTPIPSDTVKESHGSQNQVKNKAIADRKKQQAAAEQKRLQKEEKKRKLIEKKRLAAAEQAKHKRDIKAKSKQSNKKNDNENEYLLETPAIENKSRKKSQSKRSRRSQWLPQSSSKTSSVLVPPSSGGITNRRSSFSSIKSYNYSAILSSLSGILTTIIRPISDVLTSTTNKLISLISKYISIIWSIIINTWDYLWYGPINGVTTTGIVNRHGGLQSLLFNTQIGITISYIVALGLLSVLVTKLWNIKPIGDDNDSDEDDDDNAYYVDPPTVEEELRFLHHDFDARNPLAKERIAKVITKKQNRFSLPERRRRDRRNRKGRRKHAIESIQSWWKERPGQRSISIIEPQHLRNPQHTKSQSQESMKRLQKQLMESEQEREIMSRDIRDLKHDLQKAHDDSRSIVSQNKWLEKQTSQIMETERSRNGSSSSEMDRARASVKGVLDRERTRRFAENERKNQLGRGYNDLDFDKTRRGKRLADYELPNNLAKGFNDLDLNSMGRDASKRFDGIRITREIDKNDDYDAM